MALYKPTSNIIGKPLDLGDGNKVIVESMVVEAPSLRHSGTIVHIEGTVVSSEENLYQRALDEIKKSVTGELYRNFQVTPERVIYNDPATIVFWKDGTKTVVKCMEGDTYNPEVGLAMCVCKKLYDSKYHKFFRYYAPQEEPKKEPKYNAVAGAENELYEKIKNFIWESFGDKIKECTDKEFFSKTEEGSK